MQTKRSVNGSFSGWNEVLSGIPQGSVLGPLFFIIYINDLSLLMKNKILLFADDTKIYTTISCSHPISTLQKDIDMCVKWSLSWQLPFNTSKSNLLHLIQIIVTQWGI